MKALTLPRTLVRTAGFSLLLVLLVATALPTHADGPFTNRYSGEGRYATIAAGVGLEGDGAGDIVLDVPGTPIRAYLYLADFDTLDGGDDTITFAVDDNAPIELTADIIFGPDFWFGNYYRRNYVKDVTAYVLSGPHTYRISDFGPVVQSDGAGLVVVYENPNLPIQRVEVHDGLDNFFEGWTPPRGPNSEVDCFEFAPETFDRAISYYVMVGGVAARNEERPIALWAQSGNGPLPTNLINTANSFEVDGPPPPYPFLNSDGREWDTYRNTFNIPAGDSYFCMQIESVSDMGNLLGASGMWLGLGGSLTLEDPAPPPPPPPTEVPPTSIPPTSEPPPSDPPTGDPPTSVPPTSEPPAASTPVPVTTTNTTTTTTSLTTGGIPFPTRLPETGYPPLTRDPGGLIFLVSGIAALGLAFLSRRR
jgi:hypothetical protein